MPRKLTPEHLHEALDRTSICAQMVEDLLVSHPAIKAKPSWHKQAQRAAMKLWMLYQKIGAQ